MKRIYKIAASVMAVGGIAALANANPIPGLYDTGVNSSGTVLANGSVDPNYTLTTVPSPSTTTTFVLTTGYPANGPYIADNSLSAWIGPANDSSLDGPPGSYTYQTTFTLSNVNPSDSITGGWSSDNDGVAIYLNGILVSGPTSFTQFSTGFAPFSAVASDFVTGVNTLDFVVHNGGTGVGDDSGGANPTALRVEFTGSSVPDGGLTASLLGMGLLSLGYLRRMVK
jgi:hypothetical protein